MTRRSVGQTGLTVTRFGFGCAGIAGLYQACPTDQAMATLEAAWAAGIRYFDTAPFYGTGLSEQRLGAFLAGKPRADRVISTKVGRLLTPVAESHAVDTGFVGGLPATVHFDYSHDAILRSVDESLIRLQTDHIDILYVHDIGAFTHGPVGAAHHMAALTRTGITALTRLRDQGVIGAWGVGVNETAVCLDLLERGPLDVILLAGRYTLLDRQAEADLLPACRAQGVPLVIGGVLNSGILATGPVANARFNYDQASQDILDRVAGLERECALAGCGLLSAALNFPLQNPDVAAVLLGAADPASLQQNLQAALNQPAPQLYLDTAPFSLRAGVKAA